MLPLDGVTVISLEHAIAAPLASRHLADQGARVIKIERPEGDFARSYDQRARSQASHFVWANRSKESVCLDLKSEVGKHHLRQLISTCDIFLQNLGPGVCEALGFGPPEVRRINPNCITCSISGYGSGGPFERRKAYDLLIQAESGLLSITGTENTPCKVGISIADIAAGVYAYTNILNALILRQRGFAIDHIDISMLEALTEWLGFPLYYCMDDQPMPIRAGASHATIFPYGPYQTKQGDTILIAIQHDRDWQAFCSYVLHEPALAQDSMFATNSQRNAARETLQPVIVARIGKLSTEELVARLTAHSIAFSEFRTIADLWTHPQLQSRERFVEIDTPVGKLPALLPPGATTHSVRMDAVPALGAHTKSILMSLRRAADV